MRELFDAELNITDEPRTQPELVAAMRAADVLVPTVTDKIDAALIEQAGPQMKLIANFGNGVDNIDIDAAQKKGITVTNTPNVLSDDTADMTMALMLAVPRRLTEGGQCHRRLGRCLERLVADMDARPPHRRQAARHHRHGPHRHRGCPPRQGLRPVDPLPQPPTGRSRHRRPAGGDLLGQPRPDAGPRRHRLGALPLDARDLPPSLRPPARADEARCLYRQFRPRRHHRRGRAESRRSRRGRLSGAGLDVFRTTSRRWTSAWSSSPPKARWCCCRTWARPPSRAASDMGDKVIINIRTFFDGHPPARPRAAAQETEGNRVPELIPSADTALSGNSPPAPS